VTWQPPHLAFCTLPSENKGKQGSVIHCENTAQQDSP